MQLEPKITSEWIDPYQIRLRAKLGIVGLCLCVTGHDYHAGMVELIHETKRRFATLLAASHTS